MLTHRQLVVSPTNLLYSSKVCLKSSVNAQPLCLVLLEKQSICEAYFHVHIPDLPLFTNPISFPVVSDPRQLLCPTALLIRGQHGCHFF